MANTILIKRSGTANSVPLAGSLTAGELAINYNDGNLFYKDAVGNVQVIASNQFLSVTGNVTGGNLITSGLVSVTGNVAAGNLKTYGNVEAAGDVVASGVLYVGSASVVGNIFVDSIFANSDISAGNIDAFSFTGDGANITGINAFGNITVAGDSILANTTSDTVSLVAGSGVTIIADPDTNEITFAIQQSGSSIFVDGADFGLVTEAVTQSDDLGLITVTADTLIDLGTLVVSGLIYPDQFVLPTASVGDLPGVFPAGQMIFVPDETGGPVPAFSDGTNWRRVTDRAIVS